MQRDSGDENTPHAPYNLAKALESRSGEVRLGAGSIERLPAGNDSDADELESLALQLGAQGNSVLADKLRAIAERMTQDDPAPLPEGSKENNPKDAFGILKASMSWVPASVIMELAVAMAEGGFKYGGANYLVAAPRSSVYTDGAERHIFQYHTLGQDTDSESGCELHHITKAIASLTVLRAAQINGTWIDDRPPPAPPGFLDGLNQKMKQLAEKFPNPVARYLANGKRGPGRIL